MGGSPRASKAARGQLSDRIAIGMLIAAFPPREVDAAIDAVGVREQRSRALPARTMVYFALAMWLFGGAGYNSVLTKLTTGMGWTGMAKGKHAAPGTGSITKARRRLGPEVMRTLFQLHAAARRDLPYRWRGLTVRSLDGGTVDVPDTAANLLAFNAAEVRMLVLASQRDGALVDVAMGAADDDLHSRLLSTVPAETLVVASPAAPSVELLRSVGKRGAYLLWRQSAAIELPCLRVLPDNSYVSRLLPDGDPTSRSVEIRVVAAGRDHLVTTLLDPGRAPAAELVSLHRGRWRFEAVFDALETGPVALRSQDPRGVAQELWAMFCVYQAIQGLRSDRDR
ncbi:Insertion element 4 transposase N-terminal [Actinokineospora alba]|uniref:Insertion element 4 transposase N-terminal n=1 Tax=Actinokineospora alba TaxID=504798 RepID=A0A1H0F753_9PSEU|nr:transposase domain-containing protein [Actinokineospora alba]TDP69365.1 transposase IS4-like protein [Actinokineospora alba]SDI18315.1 Insertion element 4 transposase N-terminal [Actinokineospora alba]SDN90391.1 Insertion element 4 transposase N-terminal [Actinokineospora alba]